MLPLLPALLSALTTALPQAPGPSPAPATIHVYAGQALNQITPWMYGSCIEDVNHEIYGGLYAQQIFGESFEEPPAGASPLAGWKAYGGEWTVEAGSCRVAPDTGAKIVRDLPEIQNGSVECDVQIRDARGDNAGLILRVGEPRTGADAWIGYEISISVRNQSLILGRHRNNWQLLRSVPASISAGRWHHVRVEMEGPALRIYLDRASSPTLEFVDRESPISTGKVGLRTWNSLAAFRNLVIRADSHRIEEALDQPAPSTGQERVSGMWDSFQTGTATAHYGWDSADPFNTAHAQRIEYRGGIGRVGIVNRGLNRWGIAVKQDQVLAGRLYLRQAPSTGSITVALQSADGQRTHAQQRLDPGDSNWSRRDFTLTSHLTDPHARFALWLDQPGAVWVDQVTLHGTGSMLFHGLPIRADIGTQLVAEGLTFLRYGGSMVNAPGYRWKQMIGDRDRRPQYKGTWYPQSTNGFGIEEFVQFCEAAHIEPAFAINIEETPEDAGDLVEYLNGPVSSRWGRKRAENGHPRSYHVRFIEIGNEETTNAHYLERFHLLEAAMHRRDPALQLVIAAWWEPDNPVSRRIVEELNGKAALWDVHVGGDDLREGANVDRLFTRMEQLVQSWAPGTTLKACVFEENGDRHDLQRALGHAHILNVTQRHGDFVRMDCPANCLQPWRQNDNGWNQGQLFFTPDQVWGMPPFYAQQMAARNHLPLRVGAELSGNIADLDVTATRSTDSRTLVLKIVHLGPAPLRAAIDLDGFPGVRPRAEVWTLAGDLAAINTPETPEAVHTQASVLKQAAAHFEIDLLPTSYTIVRLHR